MLYLWCTTSGHRRSIERENTPRYYHFGCDVWPSNSSRVCGYWAQGSPDSAFPISKRNVSHHNLRKEVWIDLMRMVSCSWASIFQSYKEERLQTVDKFELNPSLQQLSRYRLDHQSVHVYPPETLEHGHTVAWHQEVVEGSQGQLCQWTGNREERCMAWQIGRGENKVASCDPRYHEDSSMRMDYSVRGRYFVSWNYLMDEL